VFRTTRWRIVTLLGLIVGLVMAGLALFISRPACINNPDCIGQSVALAAALLFALTVGFTLLTVERLARPMQALTQMARRITQGELDARLLPQQRDEAGQAIQAVNQMVEQLREQIGDLYAEHEQLSTVMTHMADGVLITDDLGYVNLINPAAARLLKTTEMGALGRSFAEVVRHYQLIELWQRCREENREQVEAVEIGRDLFLQAYVSPFQARGVRGYLVILQDLTQVRRLQTVRRDFISNLSHELRTPLASLRAIVETIQDGALDDPPAAQRFLARAEREVDTLTQMVEELLELSRIESGQAPLRLAPTAVSNLILLPIERLRPQADRAGVELILDLPADLPRVLADADRVQQVVTNLVHNAIKFTLPPGKITMHAAVETHNDVRAVVISVKDTGVGIPARDLPRIFERFYKSDRARTRSQGGTGLGLAIARHIVEAHHGRIWAASKEGKGSVFYFTLPVSL
jgi:two-component system, OmpR family, phosphate regulon sensor histidine kinase PhoR